MFLLGFFVMILALLPNGTNIFKLWASKIFGFAAMKVFLTFLFTILIAVNNILFENSKNEGWVAILALQVMFYLILFIKRNSLISMFVSLQSDFTNPYMSLNKLRTVKDMPFMYNFARNSERQGNINTNQPKNIRYNIYQTFNRDRNNVAGINNRDDNLNQSNNGENNTQNINNVSNKDRTKRKIPSTNVINPNIKSRNSKTAFKRAEDLKTINTSKDSKNKMKSIKNIDENESKKDIETNFNMRKHIRRLKNKNTVNTRNIGRYKNVGKHRNISKYRNIQKGDKKDEK
jgi:hypothetical protein